MSKTDKEKIKYYFNKIKEIFLPLKNFNLYINTVEESNKKVVYKIITNNNFAI